MKRGVLAVYNFLLMDVAQPGHDLLQKILGLKLADSFPFLEHFVEGVVGAKFQHHVYVIGVLKDVVKSYDVAMFEGFVYLDLSD
jgi:hypothetical protein